MCGLHITGALWLIIGLSAEYRDGFQNFYCGFDVLSLCLNSKSDLPLNSLINNSLPDYGIPAAVVNFGPSAEKDRGVIDLAQRGW